MLIKVGPYMKPDGFKTRHWAVYVDGGLLTVTLYRKGANAVAEFIQTLLDTMKPNDAPKRKSRGKKASTPTQGFVTSGAPSVSEGSWNAFPKPEPEAARRKRRKKGLLRKILGESPF